VQRQGRALEDLVVVSGGVLAEVGQAAQGVLVAAAQGEQLDGAQAERRERRDGLPGDPLGELRVRGDSFDHCSEIGFGHRWSSWGAGPSVCAGANALRRGMSRGAAAMGASRGVGGQGGAIVAG
jgi:hypothetical protein